MRYILFIVYSFCLYANRESSFPYISGDTFRLSCDFTFDELNRFLDPSLVQDGNTIFLKPDYMKIFFSRIHPRIKARYILVTHNSDFPVPGNYAAYLDDEKIMAWFGQNVEGCTHPKLHPIPIGIANRCWDHGNIERMHALQQRIPSIQKTILLYMNFDASTYLEERTRVREMFLQKPYCLAAPTKTQTEYLLDLAASQFVLSPRGNGLDCHRIWECLLMGAIPIVITSSLDEMFADLPVLIINRWEDITEDFLHDKYEEMQRRTYCMEKIYAPYWLHLIRESASSAQRHR